jgi:hypothetical protein
MQNVGDERQGFVVPALLLQKPRAQRHGAGKILIPLDGCQAEGIGALPQQRIGQRERLGIVRRRAERGRDMERRMPQIAVLQDAPRDPNVVLGGAVGVVPIGHAAPVKGRIGSQPDFVPANHATPRPPGTTAWMRGVKPAHDDAEGWEPRR